MKKLYFLVFAVVVGISVTAQEVYKNREVKRVPTPIMSLNNVFTTPFDLQLNKTVSSSREIIENEIGDTFYDMQSNTSSPANRFYMYEDGTMAAVWTRGITIGGNYPDRGTGYNYFNGASWNPVPNTRIETQRTGWPTYAPQMDGEIVAAHHNTAGLVISRRDTKGTGVWSEAILPGPEGAVDISWPKIVSSGENHQFIHMLAMTYSAYQNLDLALLYYRSEDGGETWSTQHEVLPGMTSDDYVGFSADTYSWAEAKGDTIAFIVCDPWTDMFIMKSNDNGENWEKIMVWEHPYPMFNGEQTDSTYVPDGGAHIAFDNNGTLHLAFSVYRVLVTDWSQGYSYFPFASGIAYWNTNMPAWTNTDINTLDPDALFESGNLAIGMWDLDLDGNGSLDFVNDFGNYGLAAASMPQITVDENGFIYLVFSALTEGFDNGAQQYRHIWARGSSDGGATWRDMVDLTGDITHMFDECVFPSIANRTEPDMVHIIFQADTEPGLSQGDDGDTPTQNLIYHLAFDKADVVNIGVDDPQINQFAVSQNYPNPFSGYTQIGISLYRTSTVSVTVNDFTGRQVYKVDTGSYSAGNHIIPLSLYNLSKGVYTYTVSVNGISSTKKMIIK